jgi:Kef-type K+ transport system membrane component KefB
LSETKAVTEPGEGDGGTYAAFIEKELEDQRASKASIEQRGVAVVSTTGILVTLLFGFSAIARDSEKLDVPSSAHLWFYLALAAFVIAASLALLANIPRKYQGPKPAVLMAVIRTKWGDPSNIARRRVSSTRIAMIESYQQVNRWKAIALAFAIGSEVAAVLFLAVAIGLVITNS